MFDISGLEHYQYKAGVEYVKMGKLFYVDQNPDSNSYFASQAKAGHKIMWELSNRPIAGNKLAYTGKLVVDGQLMSKEQAHVLLKGAGNVQSI